MTDAEVITLKEFIEKQNALQAQVISTRLDAIEKATELAREQMEKRLEGMNEFREALKDQNSLFVTKEMHNKIEADIQELRTFKDEQSGKASQAQVYIAWLIAILGLVLGAVAIFR